MPEFELVSNLEILAKTHPTLANLFRRYWDTPLQDYAAQLYQVPTHQIDPLFIEVFQEELENQDYSKEEAKAAAEQLQANPVLQTSHHITPTHGPTFCTLDLQCLSGLTEESIYLIGANSGVAFSNTAWSGALSYEGLPLDSLIQGETPLYKKSLKAQEERQNHGEAEERISLIPAKLRDQLVYGEKIPANVVAAYAQLTPNLQELLAMPQEGASYSNFAVQSAKGIQERIFQKKLVIFDLNQVATSYLLRLTAEQPTHPLIQFLQSPEQLQKLTAQSGQSMTFLGSYQGKKSKKIEKFTFDGCNLTGQKTATESCTWGELTQKLKRAELCVGVLPLFLTLSFSLGIKCLGSFNQIEYLGKIHQALQEMNLNWGHDPAPTPALTTGRLQHKKGGFMPLTLAMKKETISLSDFTGKPMGYFWQFYLQKLSDET